MPQFKSISIAALLAGAALWGAAPACAEEPAGQPLRLAPVEVTGTIDNPATGKSTIPGEVIRDLPRGNGSINELLRVLPDVQLSEDFNTNKNAGEILPPNLSISGGKAFENNFVIDGIGNNSLLDPATRSADLVSDVPGHPQQLFLLADLVDEITVFDSSVPVEYGGFTGGVVEVKTRRPRSEFGGGLAYRTTRDQWTRFHLDEGQQAEAELVGRIEDQPRFEKHQAFVSLDLPLGDSAGLLGAYGQVFSKIPLAHLGGSKAETRRGENYFLKGVWDPTPEDALELSLTYAPYREERFFADVLGSDFELEGGGISLSAGYRHFFSLGELSLEGALQASENSRRGPRHFRSWAITDNKDWGLISGSDVSPEGGFGSVEKTQQGLAVKGVVNFDERFTGPVGHGVQLGFEAEMARGTFEREETTFVFKGARTTPDIICGEDTFACEEQEQFFTLRNVYDPASVIARINSYHLFAEDQLGFRRLSLRPGVRLSYDDFMENLNLSPRLAAGYDLFGDGRTRLVAGAARYYGRSLLTYKLREARPPFRSEARTSFQNRPTDWEPAAFQGVNVTRFSRLDTPYADELTAGVDQALFGGRLSLKYVHREGRDEFARSYGEVQPDGLRYYTLNNHGSSRHDGYRLSWERRFRRQFLSLNATYQETLSSNEDYDTTLEADELEDRVWYGDDILLKTELPRGDYNRPWVLNLTWIAQLPGGFTFTNLTWYRSGYETIEPTGIFREIPGGERRSDPLTGEEIFESLEIYEAQDRAAALLFDWKLNWRKAVYRDQELGLSLEVYNVFDEKIRAGRSRDTFVVGRQFWAGAEYRF
ncbi:TonB-dependent receptor [Desulfuromonas versatilis]|uniref:TonB-dependent receptor n=1 Tax=Desulfuromonas versatilis TaxID=2802975 RepID=A0ABN6DS04_9BACT|nr:TonB-dependent receptor plug domain-containing protein [Desulfuromonas versatilis]BCR03008.1 TonB-dependent receptor [Desulfuromonas versatilis]